MQDLRYAFRLLRRQPIFATVAVLTLALGIGANTAIFSVVYHLLLRPLPFPHAERLVFVWNAYPKGGSEPSDVSIPDYLDRRAQAPSIEDAALFTPRNATLSSGERPEQLVALAVTPTFFSTLQRAPVAGRAFTDADAASGAARVVILTDEFWAAHFGRDRSIVGRDIRLDGQPWSVVGVLPPDFELPWRKVAVLVPFAFTAAQQSDAERGNEFSMMIARLREGRSIGQLNVEMRTIVDRLIDRLPQRAAFMRTSGFTGVAIGMRDQLVGDVRNALYLLQASAIVLLLIACANVANLLLMRATGRQRELAIRAALGAGRRRILRQLLAEGAVLTAIGAAAGVATAAFGVKGLLVLAADQLPDTLRGALDPAALVVSLALAAVTAVVFGVVPAFAIGRGRIGASLNEDTTRGSTGARTGTIRGALIVAETALAVVLLIGAGLLVKSFAKLVRVNPGFSPERVLTADISLPRVRYRDAASRQAFWDRLLLNAKRIPGTAAAGLISTVPFSGRLSSGSYVVAGQPLDPSTPMPHARQDQVLGDYFRAMGIPLVEGRLFDDTDTATSPRVVVVDRFLAARRFPGASALGRQLNFGSPRNYTIVGVVGTINDADLAQPVAEERIYFNGAQIPNGEMKLVLKAALEPTTLIPQVAAAVRAIDPEQAVAEARTMDQWMSRSLAGRRTPTTLLVLFGGVALLLSAIGTYGVLAFGVAQRTREFGIRRALGASRASILSLVFAHGLRTAGVGIAIGIAASMLLTRYVQSMLYGVQPHDALVLGGVAALLAVVGGVACYVPARRALAIPPTVALRDV